MKTEQRLTVAKAGSGGGGERAQRSRHEPSEHRGRYTQHGDCREEHCAGDVNLSRLQGTVEDKSLACYHPRGCKESGGAQGLNNNNT